VVCVINDAMYSCFEMAIWPAFFSETKMYHNRNACIIVGINQRPPKGHETPLEALYRHLPKTPFHGGLQRVKGKVDRFTELIRETMIN